MKVLFLALMCVGLAGCAAHPIGVGETGNPDVSAALIAHVDGCNIWRLKDGNDRHIYFARCSGGSVRTSWKEMVGKIVQDRETLGDK